MGLFDRFKKKKASAGQARAVPSEQLRLEADTMLLPLFGSVLTAEDVSEAARRLYGPKAVRSIDNSHPLVPALTLDLDGISCFCSCMPMPQPKEVCDFSQIAGGLYSQEERQIILDHKCFLVLAQEGGGTSLEEKRRICRVLTQFTGELMKREDAAGVYVNAAQLLISPRSYRFHAEVLAENLENPEYFPSPLWVGIVHAYSNNTPVIATLGMRHFGFCELGFLNPKSEWPDVHQKLYLMAIFEITGKELYRSGDTIGFDPNDPAICKQEGQLLLVMGGGV